MAKKRAKKAHRRAKKAHRSKARPSGGRRGKAKGKRDFKRLGAPKRGGTRNKDTVKVHAVKPLGGKSVWEMQTVLRNDGYFARAVGPNKVVTNAPIKTK